jgi:hypothetical protein
MLLKGCEVRIFKEKRKGEVGTNITNYYLGYLNKNREGTWPSN